MFFSHLIKEFQLWFNKFDRACTFFSFHVSHPIDRDKDDFSAEIENNNYCVCCDSVKTVAGNICLRYLKLVIKTSDKIFNFILSIQPKYPYCTGICKECITLNNTLNTTIETTTNNTIENNSETTTKNTFKFILLGGVERYPACGNKREISVRSV